MGNEMDDAMIERCAKALALKHWPDDTRWPNYVSAVKAVIEAMREPTTKMIKAALHDYMYREKN